MRQPEWRRQSLEGQPHEFWLDAREWTKLNLDPHDLAEFCRMFPLEKISELWGERPLHTLRDLIEQRFNERCLMHVEVPEAGALSKSKTGKALDKKVTVDGADGRNASQHATD